jgi:hypothetical protein
MPFPNSDSLPLLILSILSIHVLSAFPQTRLSAKGPARMLDARVHPRFGF